MTGDAFRRMRRGLEVAAPAERAAFGSLASFAVTVAAARTINFVRERRRSFPRLRSFGRQGYHAPGTEQLRVHHFLPGIGLLAIAGAIAIFRRDDGRELALSVPFGTGAGLVLDEIALLVKLDNPYWESERLALAQAAIAALGSLGLAARIAARSPNGRGDNEHRNDPKANG